MKRYLKYPLYTALLIILASACFSSKPAVKKKKKKPVPRSINFYYNKDYSLTEITEIAKTKNKLVFVYFSADWCLPCKVLEEEIYNQKHIYSLYNKHFINYKVDITEGNGPNLKLMYGATELPTLLMLNAKGQIQDQYKGGASEQKIMDFAHRNKSN